MPDRHPRAGCRQRRAIGVSSFLFLPDLGLCSQPYFVFTGDGLVSLGGARLHSRGGRVPGEGDLMLAQVADHLARARGACYIGAGAGAAPGAHRGGSEQEVQGGRYGRSLSSRM